MSNLSGKKILMFYPYGTTKHYGDSIKDELIGRGAIVFSYDERPSQTTIIKIVIRLLKKKIPSLFLLYIKKIINKNQDIDFDYIFVARGEAFSQKAVNILRAKYRRAFIILYLWDILETNNLKNVVQSFDRVLSFDPQDVKDNSSLIFRPTFFIPNYKNIIKSSNPTNDIVFIGTLHSKRYQTINTLKAYFTRKKMAYNFYLFVPSILIFFKNKLLKYNYARLKEVNFQPMSLLNTLDIIGNSKCILDINFSGQKSLSMRAFEAMVSKTKYITTNPDIKNYDFYNKKNILVIDMENVRIPLDFINSPFEEIPLLLLDKYSVKQLVDDIFFGKTREETNYFFK